MKAIKKIGLIIMMTLVIAGTAILTACGGGREIQSISLDTSGEGVVLMFTTDEEFSATGVKVLGHLKNGSTTRVSLNDCTVSKPDMTTAGEKTITVTYEGKSATYKINVVVFEIVATFTGPITIVAFFGTFIFDVELKCYSTFISELWYTAMMAAEPAVQDSGKYTLANGVYTFTHTLAGTISTTTVEGVVSLEYSAELLVGMGMSGPGSGTLTLVTE